MNDLIRRSDAIKAVNKAKAEGMVECPTYYIGLIPSADRPQGEWIIHFDDLFPEESSIECSVCHEEQPLGIDDNYCPNCGCWMKGADDDRRR